MKKFKSAFTFVSTAFLILNVLVMGPVSVFAQEAPIDTSTLSVDAETTADTTDEVSSTPEPEVVPQTTLPEPTLSNNEVAPPTTEDVDAQSEDETINEDSLIKNEKALSAPAMLGMPETNKIQKEEEEDTVQTFDVENSCPLPDPLDDTTPEDIKEPNGQKSLKTILSDNYPQYIDMMADQQQYQVWNVTPNSQITINAKYVDKQALNEDVFGYYAGGDINAFIPVFKTADISGYSTVPLYNSGTFTVNTGTSDHIAFAIKSFAPTPNLNGRFSTENSKNYKSVDQAVVYNPNPDQYVIGFEDLNNAGDHDFNDLVVEVNLGCKPIDDSNTDKIKVHVFKYLSDDGQVVQIPNGADVPEFNMIADYSIAGVGAGSGPYILGNGGGSAGSDNNLEFAANTIPLSVGDDYGTHEEIGNGVVATDSQSCPEGEYRLLGYKTGTTLALAQAAAISTTAPQYNDIDADQYVIVVNELCPDDTGENPTEDEHTTVVRQADLTNTANNSQWYFYNDTTDQINNMNSGSGAIGGFSPDHPMLGSGSAYILPLIHDTDRTALATSKYAGTKLADIKSLSFSEYTSSGNWSSSEVPFVRFNIDFTGGMDTSYQKSLVYVPSVNAVVNQNNWSNWDMINSGSAKWVYSGATWPAPINEPGTNPKAWSEILAAYPNAQMHATIPFFGVRIGEPGPAGFSSFVDNIKVGIKTGSNTHTETYDFEPTFTTTTSLVERKSNSSHRGSRGTGIVAGDSTGPGEVLGAETSCGIYVDKFLKKGKTTNDVASVIKVQKFLNDYTQAGLVADGNYGAKTEAALKAFQLAHKDKILLPWNLSVPTGIFYLTTQTEVNNIMCPALNLPIPTNLIPYSKNPVTPKI